MDEQRAWQIDNEIDDYVCECSEEYGPCEVHCTVLAQRAGASNRTGDELALVFLEDVRDALADYDEKLIDIPTSDRAALRASIDKLNADITNAYALPWSSIHRDGINHDGDGWLDADENPDASDILQDMVRRAEEALSDIGANVYWDDGYVISRMSDDCPLRDDTSADDADDDASTIMDDTSADEITRAYEAASAPYRPAPVTTKPTWADRARATGQTVWTQENGWSDATG